MLEKPNSPESGVQSPKSVVGKGNSTFLISCSTSSLQLMKVLGSDAFGTHLAIASKMFSLHGWCLSLWCPKTVWWTQDLSLLLPKPMRAIALKANRH